jgi:hypothetical protein
MEDKSTFDESSYLQGQKTAWQELVRLGLSHLDGQEKTRTELILEREQAIAMIKKLLKYLGEPVRFTDDANLSDIIEDHLYYAFRDHMNG